MNIMSVPISLVTALADFRIQGYPDEWFPSVSSTIGDRYPERSVFMVFIAITSGMKTGNRKSIRYLPGYRPSFCISGAVVRSDKEVELDITKIHCWGWHIPDINLRRMDICYVH